MTHIIDHPSPNFGDRPDGSPIDILVLHYTGMQSGQIALDRLCDPASSVSCHYLVEEDGRIFRLVDEGKRAWHAGRGEWQKCSDVNSRSIGIEIVNPGHEHGYRPFPKDQITSVIALCRDILDRQTIPASRIIAHSDMAPDRKEDPGELFPWHELARHGIGLWPQGTQGIGDTEGTKTTPPDTIAPDTACALFDRLLGQIGYGEGDGLKRRIAFQRHWRPADISGVVDAECLAIAQSLLALRAELTGQSHW